MISLQSHRLYHSTIHRWTAIRNFSLLSSSSFTVSSSKFHAIRTLTSSFSTDDKNNNETEWIPPSRPLSGDKGNYEHVVNQQLRTTKEKYKNVEEEKGDGSFPPLANENLKGQFVMLNEKYEDVDDDVDDDEFDEEDFNEENWVDPFEAGHSIKSIDDIAELIKKMKQDGIYEGGMFDVDDSDEDFEFDEDNNLTKEGLLGSIGGIKTKADNYEEEDMFDDDDEDELFDNMASKGELTTTALKDGKWIDLQDIKVEDLQRIFEEMEPSKQSSSSTNSQKLLEHIGNNSNSDDDEDIPDWNSARRKRLGGRLPSAMLTPRDARAARQLDGEIPVNFHTLLTCDEITDCLQSLGGINVVVISLPAEAYMGKAMIVATGTTGTHLRTMADAIVRSLRARKLHKMGVVAADSGAEGYDCDDWIVVDCRNYTVHLQDEITRKHIALEKHWSAEEISKRRKNPLNFNDEEKTDEYVRDHPIPDEYALHLLRGGKTAEEAAGGVSFDAKKLRKTTVLPVLPSSRRKPKGGKAKGHKGKKR